MNSIFYVIGVEVFFALVWIFPVEGVVQNDVTNVEGKPVVSPIDFVAISSKIKSGF